MDDMYYIKILWDYMQMHHQPKKCDCIMGLGTVDTKVAELAAELYLEGYGNFIIFAGGLGKRTKNEWPEGTTEADVFAKIAQKKGVPAYKIYKEGNSNNTGANFENSKKLIEENNLDVKSIVVVCKPYDQKRTYAACKKKMPEYDCIIVSKKISCEDYYKKHGKEWVHVLVGDIPRMIDFYEKGWQIKIDVPPEVWNAYKILRDRGYNKFDLKVPYTNYARYARDDGR